MESLDLIGLQIRLEYQVTSDGLLAPFPGSSEQAFYLVYRYSGGYISYFNYMLPTELRQQLLTIGPAQAFTHPGKVNKLISEFFQLCRGGKEVFWSGYFTNPPGHSEFPDVIREANDWVVEVEEQVVCRATSVRQNTSCAEAYVETQPVYQRRGYGRQATAAWAHDILRSGRVPFYSYRLANSASAALAKSLRVEWYADVVGYARYNPKATISGYNNPAQGVDHGTNLTQYT
jgi:hypothetical protein